MVCSLRGESLELLDLTFHTSLLMVTCVSVSVSWRCSLQTTKRYLWRFDNLGLWLYLILVCPSVHDFSFFNVEFCILDLRFHDFLVYYMQKYDFSNSWTSGLWIRENLQFLLMWISLFENRFLTKRTLDIFSLFLCFPQVFRFTCEKGILDKFSLYHVLTTGLEVYWWTY